MISSKPPTSTLQPGAQPDPTPPNLFCDFHLIFFLPPHTQKAAEEENIHGDKYWNELSLYMSRGHGCRNAQCIPLRSKQWFIKSNLFEGGVRKQQRSSRGQTWAFILFFFSNAFFDTAGLISLVFIKNGWWSLTCFYLYFKLNKNKAF